MFIALYAQAESLLKITLREVVGVDKPTALAIFSGTKTDQACTFIRRCYTARKNAMSPLLDAAISKLLEINTSRNDVIHYTPDLTAPEPIVTNERGALVETAIRRVPFTDRVMLTHVRDLADIIVILSCFPDLQEREARYRSAKNTPAWIAKALEPKSRGRKKTRQGTRRERKSPPEPSQA
jgi:hypothetical protein